MRDPDIVCQGSAVVEMADRLGAQTDPCYNSRNLMYIWLGKTVHGQVVFDQYSCWRYRGLVAFRGNASKGRTEIVD